MKYRFILDGSDVTSRVELGASVKERFAEELDVGGIALTYWDTGDAIKVLSRVDIEELSSDGQTVNKRYNMLVMRDVVEPITKSSPIKYRHQLDLIELTHKLDYYIVNALTFTQPIVDLVTAPFESTYEIYLNDNLVNEGFGGFDLPVDMEFPKLPEIFNRYVDGIEIKQLEEPNNKTNVWELAYDGQGNLTVDLYENTDIFCKLERVKERLNSDNEILTTFVEVQSNINITQNDFIVNDLEEGKYKLTLSSSVSGIQNPLYTEIYDINRKFEYYIEIENHDVTILDIIKRIRDVSPIEKSSIHEETRLFDISTELEQKLSNIKAPQLYLNKLTTREALNEAFKYVNAISRLIRNEKDILNADFFNNKEGSYVYDISEVFSIIGSQDNINYVSNNRAFLKNVINTNQLDNPSVNELGNLYKGIRSSKFQMLPENGLITLQYKIYRLLSVKTKVFYEFVYTPISQDIASSAGEVISRVEELEIDLTPYIVEENVLNIARKFNDVFGSTRSLRKLNRKFYRDLEIELGTYRYGTNRINLGGEVGSMFPRTKFERILESAIAEKLSYLQGKRFDESLSFGTRGHASTFSESEVDATLNLYTTDGQTKLDLASNDFLKHVPISITYIALDYNVIDSHKEDTTIIDKYSEKITNINAPVVNYERAAINNYGIAQRLGVPTISYGKISKNINNENVGDVNQNNEVIVEKESVFYNDHKFLKYEASRDFNRLSQFVKVDRAYRPFENPTSDGVMHREDIYNEYIEYSTSNDLITPNDNNSFISNLAMETILNSFKYDDTLEKDYVKMVLLRTDGFLKQNPDLDFVNNYLRNALIIPVISQGGKNTLSFKFGFNSNISAGDFIRENYEIDDIFDLFSAAFNLIQNVLKNNYFARPYGLWREFVTYGDKNGYFDKMHFKFLTDFNLSNTYASNGYFSETKDLPLIKYATPDETSYFPNQDNKTAFESGNALTFDDAMIIKKDAGEIYSFTYQLSFTPKTNEHNEKIVLGKTFASQNLLVYPFNDKEMRLYLYDDLNDRYSKFDDREVKPAVTDVLANVEIVREGDDDIGRPYGIKINNDLTNYTHWALGDADGNLYLANNTNNPYVFFEPRNKRSTINYNW